MQRIAGGDRFAFADGPGLSGHFGVLTHMLMAADGRRMWLADQWNMRVRCVDLSKTECVVSTVAGNGFREYGDGPALQVGLGSAHTMAFDVRTVVPESAFFMGVENDGIRRLTLDTSESRFPFSSVAAGRHWFGVFVCVTSCCASDASRIGTCRRAHCRLASA